MTNIHNEICYDIDAVHDLACWNLDDDDKLYDEPCCGTCAHGDIAWEDNCVGDIQCAETESFYYDQYMCYNDHCDYYQLEED